MNCEITEAPVEDAIGYSCGNEASGQCCDCGAYLCDVHGARCNSCDELLCDDCLAFHISATYHKKVPSPEREIRRAA
jgi:hypothetical protein